MVYQVQDTWCTFVNLQEEMDRCVAYFKKIGPLCQSPSFGFATKAKSWKGAG
jgi:hypothetical protein